MSQSAKWADLRVRLISGAALVVVGLAAILGGNLPFAVLTVLVTAIMSWELAKMVNPTLGQSALAIAAISGVALVVALTLPILGSFAVIAVAAGIGTVLAVRNRAIFFVFAALLLIAGYGLVTFRMNYGVVWLIWLVVTVVATDIFGYFAGRFIGGPKFWPAISPKKTWSGTAAGWIAAFFIGAYFWSITNAGRDILWITVLLSFASQMGDIGESAVKRRMGVKDSSALIPGHGGLFDRFDGLLGASLYMLVVAQFVDIPVIDVNDLIVLPWPFGSP